MEAKMEYVTLVELDSTIANHNYNSYFSSSPPASLFDEYNLFENDYDKLIDYNELQFEDDNEGHEERVILLQEAVDLVESSEDSNSSSDEVLHDEELSVLGLDGSVDLITLDLVGVGSINTSTDIDIELNEAIELDTLGVEDELASFGDIFDLSEIGMDLIAGAESPGAYSSDGSISTHGVRSPESDNDVEDVNVTYELSFEVGSEAEISGIVKDEDENSIQESIDIDSVEEFSSEWHTIGKAIATTTTSKAKAKPKQKKGKGLKPRLDKGVDRLSRKKDQNKSAALRYREKKRLEAQLIQIKEDELETKNKELIQEKLELTHNIKFIKGLLRDVLRGKKS